MPDLSHDIDQKKELACTCIFLSVSPPSSLYVSLWECC